MWHTRSCQTTDIIAQYISFFENFHCAVSYVRYEYVSGSTDDILKSCLVHGFRGHVHNIVDSLPVCDNINYWTIIILFFLLAHGIL